MQIILTCAAVGTRGLECVEVAAAVFAFESNTANTFKRIFTFNTLQADGLAFLTAFDFAGSVIYLTHKYINVYIIAVAGNGGVINKVEIKNVGVLGIFKIVFLKFKIEIGEKYILVDVLSIILPKFSLSGVDAFFVKFNWQKDKKKKNNENKREEENECLIDDYNEFKSNILNNFAWKMKYENKLSDFDNQILLYVTHSIIDELNCAKKNKRDFNFIVSPQEMIKFLKEFNVEKAKDIFPSPNEVMKKSLSSSPSKNI